MCPLLISQTLLAPLDLAMVDLAHESRARSPVAFDLLKSSLADDADSEDRTIAKRPRLSRQADALQPQGPAGVLAAVWVKCSGSRVSFYVRDSDQGPRRTSPLIERKGSSVPFVLSALPVSRKACAGEMCVRA